MNRDTYTVAVADLDKHDKRFWSEIRVETEDGNIDRVQSKSGARGGRDEEALFEELNERLESGEYGEVVIDVVKGDPSQGLENVERVSIVEVVTLEESSDDEDEPELVTDGGVDVDEDDSDRPTGEEVAEFYETKRPNEREYVSLTCDRCGRATSRPADIGDDGTIESKCTNCGYHIVREPGDTTDWEPLARQLQKFGIPLRRSEVVALVATGHTHAETAETLKLNNRSEVAQHVRRYREEDLPDAKWIAEHAPEV